MAWLESFTKSSGAISAFMVFLASKLDLESHDQKCNSFSVLHHLHFWPEAWLGYNLQGTYQSKSLKFLKWSWVETVLDVLQGVRPQVLPIVPPIVPLLVPPLEPLLVPLLVPPGPSIACTATSTSTSSTRHSTTIKDQAELHVSLTPFLKFVLVH